MGTRSQTSSTGGRGASKGLHSTNYTDYEVKPPWGENQKSSNLQKNKEITSQFKLNWEQSTSISVREGIWHWSTKEIMGMHKWSISCPPHHLMQTRNHTAKQNRKYNQNNHSWSTQFHGLHGLPGSRSQPGQHVKSQRVRGVTVSLSPQKSI